MCCRFFGNGIFGSRDAQIVKPNKGMGVSPNIIPYKIDSWLFKMCNFVIELVCSPDLLEILNLDIDQNQLL